MHWQVETAGQFENTLPLAEEITSTWSSHPVGVVVASDDLDLDLDEDVDEFDEDDFDDDFDDDFEEDFEDDFEDIDDDDKPDDKATGRVR